MTPSFLMAAVPTEFMPPMPLGFVNRVAALTFNSLTLKGKGVAKVLV
jgi:hypothetical protein